MRFKHGHSLFFGTMVTLALAGCGGGTSSSSPPTSVVPPVIVPPTPVNVKKTFSSCVNDNGLNSVNGSYMLVNNIWNPKGATTYTQCASATIGTLSGVEKAQFDWDFTSTDSSVKSYPSIAYGQKSGYTQSTTAKLPVLVSELGDLHVTGQVNTACLTDCLYDTAIDVFFSKTKTTVGFSPSSELMILTDYNVKQFGGVFKGRVMIDGAEYDLYQGTVVNGADANQSWNFMSYVAVVPQTKLNLNVRSFVDDSKTRGYLAATEYFDSVEMGTEVIKGKGQTTLTGFTITQ